jgi:hypothetical protein
MSIKVTPFVNPFRNIVKDNGDKVKVVEHNGKTYKQIVRGNVSR